MPLNASKISERIVSRLDSIGIRSKVGGRDSETAELVKLIVQEIVSSIRTDAEVNTTVQTTGGPTAQFGTGRGKIL